MSDLNTAVASKTTLRVIAQRVAVPFFVFSVVLSGAFVLSLLFLLPKITAVDIAGSQHDVSELHAYHESLVARITAKEKERRALINPLDGTPYRALTDQKTAPFSLLVQRSAIDDSIARILDDAGKRAVFMQSMRFHADQGSIDLQGDVRNVGPRSMTVLASFLEDLRTLPFVKESTAKRFVREEDPIIGFHSPFVIHLTLE